MTRSRTYIATPPGASIKEQLINRGMSQKDFATRMDMSEKHISKLINGDVQLTPDVALRLEFVLGIDASFWSNLEAIYREKLARIEAEKSLEADLVIARQFPYTEMARFEWVPKTKDLKEQTVNLRRYFEIVSLSLLDNTSLTFVNHKLAITSKSDMAVLAWIQEARIKAREVDTNSVNVNKLQKQLSSIKNMVASETNTLYPELQLVLAECGVALVLVPHLTGSSIKCVTFTEGKKIVIGITERNKYDNKFRNDLFLEIAHIILGHIGNQNEISDTEEEQAEEWVKEFFK